MTRKQILDPTLYLVLYRDSQLSCYTKRCYYAIPFTDFIEGKEVFGKGSFSSTVVGPYFS